MKTSINLLPRESPEEKKIKARTKRNIIFALLILFLGAALWAVPFVILQDFLSKENAVLSQISQEEQTLATLAMRETTYRTVLSRAQAVEAIFQTERSLVADIGRLKEIAGADVNIIEITIDKNKVKMVVSALDSASILSFIESLEDDERVGRVLKQITLSAITVDKVGGYQVRIEGVLSS